VAELIIGNHRLQGALVPCPKPFAVIKRASHDCSVLGKQPEFTNSQDTPLGTKDEGGSGKSRSGTWVVIGIVKHRFLFRSRPQNMVSSESLR
jgi:chromosome transmission fidelity protein 8